MKSEVHMKGHKVVGLETKRNPRKALIRRSQRTVSSEIRTELWSGLETQRRATSQRNQRHKLRQKPNIDKGGVGNNSCDLKAVDSDIWGREYRKPYYKGTDEGGNQKSRRRFNRSVNGRQIKSVDTGESRKEVTPQRTLIVSGKRYQNRKGLKKRAKWCDAARHDYR